MCNDYRLRKSADNLIKQFSEVRIPLRFSTGIPNIEPLDDIRITDRAPIVRHDADGANLTLMRWSWPSPRGAPVFNFRSEGRHFEQAQRCLIPADGFYEFTAPADRASRRKDKWLFTLKGHDLFGIAGIWRAGAAKGEDAWTMLTCPPGPDVASYHDRQIVVLPRDSWGPWLGGENERALLAPLPAGSLDVARV